MLFLYVALAHNLCMVSLFKINFLFFLWLWRVLIQLAESRGGISSRQYSIAIAVVMVVMLLYTPEIEGYVYFTLRGVFPFVPWGLFVLMGIVYSREPKAATRWRYAEALLLVFAVISGLNGLMTWPNLGFKKVPLSASYFLLASALNIVGAEAVRAAPKLYRRLPLVHRIFEFFSWNLLLATVLHYVPLGFLLGPLIDHIKNQPGAWPSMQQWDWAYMLAGAVVMVSLTLIMVELANRGWAKSREWRLIQFLRAHHYATAIVLLSLLTVLSTVGKATVGQAFWEPYLHVQLQPETLATVKFVSKDLSLGAMVYFALELASYREHSGPKTAFPSTTS